MKVLYITNKPVYPKIDGGTVAMDNFMKCLLYQDIEIKHLLIETSKHSFDIKNYPGEIVEKTKPESIFIQTEVSPWKAFLNYFKKGSFNINRFYSNKMKGLIESTLIAQSFDVVILESLYVMPYIETLRANHSGKIFLRTHNVEFKIWQDLAGNETNPIKKLYLRKLAKDLEAYEKKAVMEVDGIMAISNDDLDVFQAMDDSADAILIPVAIENENNPSVSVENANFFHLGSMNWQPNIEAVNRLIKLFPLIKTQLPDAQLHIAGGNSAVKHNDLTEQGIHFDGFVENINDYARKSGILVTPLISGSGIRIKILEIMALGIPVITTEIGAQGIDYKSSQCLIIANSDSEIIRACVELATKRNKREEIGLNALKYIKENHSIQPISQKIIEFIR